MQEPSHRLRWQLCKSFGRFVDDVEFSLVSREQWHWYNAMITQDEIEDFEFQRNMTEYMASFWNGEAVRKIREARDSANKHAFADDKEFDKQVAEQDFKNNKYVKAIQKLNIAKDTNRIDRSDDDVYRRLKERKMQLPIDLGSIINEDG